MLEKSLRLIRLATIVTTHCSLRCQHCAHINNYYEKREHYSISRTVNAIKRLLEAVDGGIDFVALMGGEPMLHPALPEILKNICGLEGIKRVSISTNGTILPSQELITALRHPKSSMGISNYSEKVAPNTDKLIQIMKDEKISYHIAAKDKPWADAGGPELRNHGADVMEGMFARCLFASCPTLLNGVLYCCPRNANAVNQGYIKPWETQSLDLTTEETANMPILELKKRIIEIVYATQSVPCCDRCDFISPDGTQNIIKRGS